MEISISQENKKPLSKGMIGLFIEDINYAIDGGLHAEMLENGNFEAKNACGVKDDYTVTEDGCYAWEPFPDSGSASLKIKTDRAAFSENPHYMRLVASVNGGGMKNKAFDGIYLEKGMKYKVSFYARSYDYKGTAFAGVYFDGRILTGKKVKLKADGKWRRYEFTLKSKENAEGAAFTVTLFRSGTAHFDCFSMIPENAVFGVFRRDLVAYLKELHPGFLRFPGGCVVEGNTLDNRYLWKNSIGQRERRKHNWNRWAVHDSDKFENRFTPYSHYGQTLGIGYYEYFRLCEYLGAKPLPVVGVGMACQYQSTETYEIGSEDFETCVQDALDIVEFARGGADTVWGRVRAEMGHPHPFELEFLGVGNEQWQEVNSAGKDNEFYKRFEIFEARLHEKYPDLKLIGTVGPTVGTSTHKDAWKWMREKLKDNPSFVYATDEHFYMPPEWFYKNVHVYDDYPRDAKVYAGEYAAHLKEGGGKYNAPEANAWEGALAEAAFMTGMERNADVVVMASYAPLFARLGYTQWSPDLIWFNGKGSYATANYYVQKLFSLYAGDYALSTTADEENGVYASAVEREGMVFVKVVNASDRETEAEITGDFDFGSLTRISCMKGDLKDHNTMENPDKIVPVDVAPTSARALTLAPNSFNVLVFIKKS